MQAFLGRMQMMVKVKTNKPIRNRQLDSLINQAPEFNLGRHTCPSVSKTLLFIFFLEKELIATILL
jgi:hypothetical protein